MPIQLDKILENIAKERVLHPCNVGSVSKREVDDAWARVGRNNKLSVHESRSIFKVLQKKYEQEKIKSSSAWKLFGLMQQIHQAAEPKATPSVKEDEEQLPMDEEEYEMLEVQEPEEEDDEEGTTTSFIQPGPANSTGSASDGESPTKSMHSSAGSPDKDEKPFVKTVVGTPRPQPAEEKKVLNSLARGNTQSSTPGNALTAAALQRKGITLKKATSGGSTTKISGSVASLLSNKQTSQQRNNTIQLPESLKRKLSDDIPSTPSHTANKKSNIGAGVDKHSPKATSSAAASSTSIVHTTTTAQLMQLKKERDGITYTPPSGINIITVPAASANTLTRADLANGGAGDGASSSTAATVASTSTNGFSPNIQDINFNSGDIIFESSGINGTTTTTTLVSGNAGKIKPGINNTTEVINLGNFDNSLPPTFFKNLCLSSRHEALGLYVSNIMNRLSARNAAKLEISIVRAILDAQSEELED